MAVDFLTGFLYGVVRETWMVAAVATKYLLVANLVLLAYSNRLSIKNFQESILEYGKPLLLVLASAGTVLHISGLEITPLLMFPSYLIAVLTLGFLFWKY
jgi:uncharacterized membrane protein YphA (DoxX/SURF4 family)